MTEVKKLINQKKGNPSKIIHLSDVHIGAKAKNNRKCLENLYIIIENISKMHDKKNIIVLLSGDMLDAFNKKKARKAIEAIRELKKHVLDVIIIPGNHDYAPWMFFLRGMFMTKRTAEKFYKFFSKELNGQHTEVVRHNEYPIAHTYENNVAIIVLDSSTGEIQQQKAGKNFLAEGKIGDEQFDRLASIMTDDELREYVIFIVLHHHPVIDHEGMKLKDKAMFVRLMEYHQIAFGNIGGILFGHEHRGYKKTAAQPEKPFKKIKWVLESHSSTWKSGKNIVHRVLDISNLKDITMTEENLFK